MSEVRRRFEEIWPVPAGIEWAPNIGAYVCNDEVRITIERIDLCGEWDARLDTFTRCQETTALYVGIVDELVEQMAAIHELSLELPVVGIARESIGRAKQKLEQIK